MDDWDPALINRLEEKRSVFLLDNTGAGKSDGQVPLTYAGWADNVILLLATLDISKISLLGFSMGGRAA